MTTKRKYFTLIVVGVMATLVVVLSAQSSVMTDNSHAQHMDGSWVFDCVGSTGPMTELGTFTTDGSLLTTTNYPDMSTSHGVWVRTGDGQFTFSNTRFLFNFLPGPEGTPFTATLKVRGTLTLNETSDELSGSFASELLDPDGNMIFLDNGTVKGTRMAVEAFQ